MGIVQFILSNYSTTIGKVLYCLDRATIVIYLDDMLLVADEETIFYFIIGKNKQKSKDFHSFYNRVYKYMKGKAFYSKDNTPYIKRCIEIETNINYKDYRKYKWL